MNLTCVYLRSLSVYNTVDMMGTLNLNKKQCLCLNGLHVR